jgi:fatty acid desaturase
LTYVIVLKGLEYNRRLFTWSFIALFLGLLLESYFIFRKLNSILNCFTVSFFVSLFTFLPGKREKIYNLQNHIELWPYFFLISFIIGIIILKQKEVTSKQTEGTTLLQSLALVYCLVDYKFFDNIDFLKALIVLVIVGAVLFSLVNALTDINLGKSNRLFLSIWSSFVLMCFAIDNIIRVFSNGDIDQQNSLMMSVEVAIQYFFVGISSVYVVQNIYMLLAFLPEKNTKYKQTLYAAKKMHLDRYSDLQVSIIDALLCICYCALFFVLNSIYNFIPRHTMIWFVIVTFPILLHLQKWVRQKNYS